MENYIPKIRFKGAYDENGKWVEFTHPWEQRKLEEFFTKYQNIIYIDDNKEYTQVSVRNNGIVEYRTTTKGEKIGRKRQYVIDTDEHPITLTFTRQTVYEGGIGFVPKCLNGAIVTENMPLLEMHNADVEFMKALFKTEGYKRSVIDDDTLIGSAQKALHEKQWLASNVIVPSLKEQFKIGDYFRGLDHLITLHQRKCDLYQQAKQSMMEKLYSFNSDWEEKALGEILIRNPKSNIGVHEAQQMKCGDIPYFTSGEKIFYINDFLVKGENIFVNDGGVADIKYYNGKANYSDHILSLKNIDNSICLQFVYQSLLSKINIINDKLFHGLGLKNLSKKDFMNFTISIPSLEEQIKIANILSKYDELIAISKNQLDSIKTLKKGLLQQMFI